MSSFIYLAAWRLVRWLPEKLAYKLFSIGAEKFYKRNGRGVQRLRNNLATVTNFQGAQLEQLVIDGISSYMRYWCDTFRLPDWSKEKILNHVELVSGHLLTDRIDNGLGVAVALPHSGNWDHAAAFFISKGYRVTTVAERLKPERVFRAFLKYRQEIGIEILSSDTRTIPTLVLRAKEGVIVPLVADRDLSSNGIEVEFFGKRAKMPAGPVLISQRANVPLVGAFINYTPDGIKIYFEDIEVSETVSAGVQNVADFFAKYLRANPVDWHMLQRIWIDD